VTWKKTGHTRMHFLGGITRYTDLVALKEKLGIHVTV
jgi:hypothetical protein